jgi:hypothetical protein
MRKADLRKNHEAFEEVLRRYRDFLGRMLGARRVVRTGEDKREIAESALLRICAYWESFVVAEFVDCLNIDSSRLAEHLGVLLPKHLPLSLCEAILLRDGYFDFRSVDDLKSRAKKMLPDHVNPFAKIDKAVAKKIDEVFMIRNYLAHRSKAARRSLDRMYSNTYGFERFREPGAFLLANGYERLKHFVGAFLQASQQMKQIVPNRRRGP